MKKEMFYITEEERTRIMSILEGMRLEALDNAIANLMNCGYSSEKILETVQKIVNDKDDYELDDLIEILEEEEEEEENEQ